MASTSQRSKRHDSLLSKLDVAIQLLSSAKGVGGVAPARIALSSACILLTAIRVHSLLFSGELLVDVYLGYHGQGTRLCWSRTVLR